LQFKEEYSVAIAKKVFANNEDLTHALVISYGKKKFFVSFGKVTYRLLHEYFGYGDGKH
jgi:hypothetical protein